ncbi:MAG TPA: thiamine pyrophosphate-dependent enzyme [Syntrophobacteria bacterium]|nr:thiamine pyrophosphate-dependent enzyme [Syntrophobacteria bacterium]
MPSLLNPARPPAFCPGCSHEHSLRALDQALQRLGLTASRVVIVSDIGCSGLFDTFFTTHALHGLHGRALTYAAGIKLAQPHLTVVVTMGDGGLGIGGAHILAACRRNLDLTLLVLNNFNFGMTGGQFSCTTPAPASVASGFLNALERPMDVCSVAAAAGAPFVARASVYEKDVADLLARAISFEGFSLVDIWGLCPGRYLGKNPGASQDIQNALAGLPPYRGPVAPNLRREYASHYREHSGGARWEISEVPARFRPSITERREVVLLGTAGDRIISAGALLAHAAVSAGMHVTQKNDYAITVMRGPSVTELIISPEPITYPGVERPDMVVALSREGVHRRAELLARVKPEGRVVVAKGVALPPTPARVLPVDFQAWSIKRRERALAALALAARGGDPVTGEMLENAAASTLRGKSVDSTLALLHRAATLPVELA